MTGPLTITPQTDLLIHRTLERRVIALPFARDIFLIETHVAGLIHHQYETCSTSLNPGAPLLLRRERGNPHDELAIEILTGEGIKLGYVPRHRNPVLARLMDAGKLLVAEVASIRHDTQWGNGTDVRLWISLRET